MHDKKPKIRITFSQDKRSENEEKKDISKMLAILFSSGNKSLKSREVA